MWKRDDDQRPQATPGQPASAAPQTRKERDDGDAPRERAVLGSSIAVTGELSGGEDLLVQGRVEGKIDLGKHTVTIGRSGKVVADIYAKSIHVEGEVTGNLYGSEQIYVHKTAAVQGNLVSPRVALEDGCKVKGNIDTEPQTGERPRATRPGLPPPVGERTPTAVPK